MFFHLASLRSNVEKKSPEVQDISLVPLAKPNVDVAENGKDILMSEDSRPPSPIISESHKTLKDHTNIPVATIPHPSTPLKDKSITHSEHLKHHQENLKAQSTHNEAILHLTSVDSWIDDLSTKKSSVFGGLEVYNTITNISNLVSSQHLASINLPNFNGSLID